MQIIFGSTFDPVIFAEITLITRMHDAELYVASNQMQVRDVKNLLDDPNYRIDCFKRSIVLDIGCGPGDVTATLLRRSVGERATIIGSDISQKMIDYANNTYSDKKTVFKCMNIESNHIWNYWHYNSCDVITSFYCIHWISDQQRAAENIYDLLKDGGEFLALFLSKAPFYELYEALCCMERWKFLMTSTKRVDSPFQAKDNPDQLFRDILTKAKFQNIHVEEKFTSYTFPTKQLLLNSIIAVDPLYKRVPHDLGEEYKKTIMDIVMERELAQETVEGGMEVKYSIILAKAVKK